MPKALPHSVGHSIGTQISSCVFITTSAVQSLTYQATDSVFILFRDYPGDQTLQAYLEHAVYEGLLSLPACLNAFLLAAQSTELHNAATLSVLCRTALQYHYAAGMPTLPPIHHSNGRH